MRKRYSPELKAQIVLEMLREEKTITELASQHGLHATQLHRWRNQALANLPQVFADQDKAGAEKARYEKKIEELYTEIGRLTTQLAWLKKKGIRTD